jgi:hypothetical protein
MATKITTAELHKLIAAQAVLIAALRLEVDALFKYNTEYGDYVEARLNAKPITVKTESSKRIGNASAWNRALEAVRKAHGHEPGTYEKKDEVMAMMKAQLEAAH